MWQRFAGITSAAVVGGAIVVGSLVGCWSPTSQNVNIGTTPTPSPTPTATPCTVNGSECAAGNCCPGLVCLQTSPPRCGAPTPTPTP